MKTATTHAHPRPDETTTPCCGRNPVELPIGDRLTFRVELLTCGGAK